MDKQEIIRIGRLAKDVVENEAFQMAMNASMNQIFTDFLATSAEDQVVREKIWATGQAMDLLRKTLFAFISNGDVEERNQKLDKEQQNGN